MGYNFKCFKNRQLAVNLFYTSLVLFSGKGFAREAKRKIKLTELKVTQVAVNYKVQSLTNNVADFFDTQANQKTVNDLRFELEQRQLKEEEAKSWNTTAYGHIETEENGDDQKMVMKKMERMIINPFNMEFKATSKKIFSKKKDHKNGKEQTIPEGYIIKSSRHQVKEITEESIPLTVKVKFRPEQARGKVAVERGNLRLEADYKIGGRREVASVHTLSSLGVTTKLAYNVANKQTITSVDKKITEHVSTRLTQTSGFSEDQKAEVLYSLSF